MAVAGSGSWTNIGESGIKGGRSGVNSGGNGDNAFLLYNFKCALYK